MEGKIMGHLFRRTNRTLVSGAMFCSLALAGLSSTVSAADNSATIRITATVKAVCSLSAPPSVDLGDIPITAFDGLSAGGELTGYDKTFTIATSCSGTDKYVLTFTPTASSDGCMTADGGGMGFCLYDPSAKKIALTSTGANLEGSTASASQDIKVVPARSSKAPTAGDHAASMTVTIAPL